MVRLCGVFNQQNQIIDSFHNTLLETQDHLVILLSHIRDWTRFIFVQYYTIIFINFIELLPTRERNDEVIESATAALV